MRACAHERNNITHMRIALAWVFSVLRVLRLLRDCFLKEKIKISVLHACYVPVTWFFERKMTEKSIKEVVDEFTECFGRVEYRAESKEGVVAKSKHWQETESTFEIDADDYLRLGNLSMSAPPPSPGVVAGMLKIMLASKK